MPARVRHPVDVRVRRRDRRKTLPWALYRPNQYTIVAPSEAAEFGVDFRVRVVRQRFESNGERAIAGETFHRFMRIGLCRQRLAEQGEKQAKGVSVEYADLRKQC